MQSAKFELMSQQIIGKSTSLSKCLILVITPSILNADRKSYFLVDEMGARIDELETQMAEKVAAANQAREAKNGPTESS